MAVVAEGAHGPRAGQRGVHRAQLHVDSVDCVDSIDCVDCVDCVYLLTALREMVRLLATACHCLRAHNLPILGAGLAASLPRHTDTSVTLRNYPRQHKPALNRGVVLSIYL